MAPQIGTAKDDDKVLRSLISKVIKVYEKASHCNREQLAKELSLHAGQPISKRMLDDWTAEAKKPARFPLCFVRAFCEVTEGDELQRFALSERNLKRLVTGKTVEDLMGDKQRNKAKRSNR